MQKKNVRRFLALLLSVALMCGILPMTVWADDSDEVVVTYYLTGDSGTTDTKTCQVVTATTTTWTGTASEPGWYVVKTDGKKSLGFHDRIEVDGVVNLVLANEGTFVPGKGIHVGKDSTLTIYKANADVNASVQILANELPEGCAGIGGDPGEVNGFITINGGDFFVIGNKGAGIGAGAGAIDPADNQNRHIDINGGYVYAESLSGGAGIGGGANGVMTAVNINGGEIVAYGAAKAAGIGSGDSATGTVPVYIYGGKITAQGGEDGAGIGSGYRGAVATVQVWGGIVTAEGNGYAPGIGGYTFESGTAIYFRGDSIITATGGENGGAGIGSAAYVEEFNGSVVMFNATIQAQGGPGAAAIGGGYDVPSNAGVQFAPESGHSFSATLKAGEYNGSYGQAIGNGAGVDTQTGTTTFRFNGYEGVTVYGKSGEQALEENRVAMFSQSEVTIGICQHPNSVTYQECVMENGESRHDRTVHCKYCNMLPEGTWDREFHVFDPLTHECACGHKALK